MQEEFNYRRLSVLSLREQVARFRDRVAVALEGRGGPQFAILLAAAIAALTPFAARICFT